LLRGDAYEAVKKPLDEAVRELQRTESIIANILNFGQRSSHEDELVHIDVVIRSAIQLVRLVSNASNVKIIQNIPDNIPRVWGNVDMLRQVIVNLLLNAMDACAVKSEVFVQAHLGRECIFVDVIDQGKGVPKTMREDIFSPFFSTKAKGTGLGLSISRDLMRKMSGDLELLENEITGCQFRMTISVKQEKLCKY